MDKFEKICDLLNDKIKIIDTKDYSSFFPIITPISLEKYSINQKYSQICYSLYHNWLLIYLIDKLNLTKYDNIFFYSNLNYKIVDEKKMDIYQYLASDYLKYFYLRNNIYLDRLSEYELNYLVSCSNNYDYKYDNEKKNFIEVTYEKVIFNDIIGNNSIVTTNYGPDSSRFFAPNNAIVIGFRYDELYTGKITDDEWDELHEMQISSLCDILQIFNEANKNKLHVPHQVIVYDDFSVKPFDGIKKVKITLTDINTPARSFTAYIDKRIVIGRSVDSTDICINYDKSVSGKHCAIEMRNGKFYLTDLQSCNKTYLNENQVLSEVEISSGSIIKMGRVRMRVEMS